MKKSFSVIALLLVLIGYSSCKKQEGMEEKPPLPALIWTVDSTGKYPLSMTAVVKLPPDIINMVSETDKIGAFIGDECRGLGTLVRTGTTSVFFIMIHGDAAEQSKISFKYNSSKNPSYYTTYPFLNFTVDGNYGTVDDPKVLEMELVK
jgi:hypothetical protein